MDSQMLSQFHSRLSAQALLFPAKWNRQVNWRFWFILSFENYVSRASIGFPYRRVWMLVLNFKKVHCPYHTLHGHENILKDQLDESTFVIVGITGAMDNSHLFDEGWFTRFSGSWNGNLILSNKLKKTIIGIVPRVNFVFKRMGFFIFLLLLSCFPIYVWNHFFQNRIRALNGIRVVNRNILWLSCCVITSSVKEISIFIARMQYTWLNLFKSVAIRSNLFYFYFLHLGNYFLLRISFKACFCYEWCLFGYSWKPTTRKQAKNWQYCKLQMPMEKEDPSIGKLFCDIKNIYFHTYSSNLWSSA